MSPVLPVFLVLLVAVWIMTQVGSRRQSCVVTSLPVDEAAEVALIAAGRLMKEVPGPATLNLKPRLKLYAPTISVDLAPRKGGDGSQADIWTSQAKQNFGIVAQAPFCWRIRHKVRRRLEKADAQRSLQNGPQGPAVAGHAVAPPTSGAASNDPSIPAAPNGY